jgi:hypothetical protein
MALDNSLVCTNFAIDHYFCSWSYGEPSMMTFLLCCLLYLVWAYNAAVMVLLLFGFASVKKDCEGRCICSVDIDVGFVADKIGVIVQCLIFPPLGFQTSSGYYNFPAAYFSNKMNLKDYS